MRKFFSIDVAKVATRTSSVRLKRRPRPADIVSKHSHSQAECLPISNRGIPDVTDVGAGIQNPQKLSRLKIRKPQASAPSSSEQDIQEPVVHTSPGHYHDERKNSLFEVGTESNDHGTNTTIIALHSFGPKSLPKQDITCTVHKESSTENPLTDDNNHVAAAQTLQGSIVARTTTDKQIGVQMKSTEELEQEEWSLVRAAMQVELDPVQDIGGYGSISQKDHRPRKAWKHAGRNFFPSGSQHLDPEDVVRTVLERHAKAAKIHRIASVMRRNEIFTQGQL